MSLGPQSMPSHLSNILNTQLQFIVKFASSYDTADFKWSYLIFALIGLLLFLVLRIVFGRNIISISILAIFLLAKFHPEILEKIKLYIDVSKVSSEQRNVAVATPVVSAFNSLSQDVLTADDFGGEFWHESKGKVASPKARLRFQKRVNFSR